MPPYRRALATICVFAPLVYIYWWRFTAIDTSGSRSGLSVGEDVLNRTLGFSKIFVINLPSRSDRRDSMARAGAVSNLTFTWIDGVAADQAPDRVAPVSKGGRSSGAKASWISHMNALRVVVRENLRSALIMEDDVDWDVRIKSQLQTFASASRTWLKASESDTRQKELLDFVPPSLLMKRAAANVLVGDPAKDTIRLDSAAEVDSKVHQTVYGDNWDVLWLGHCGADFPSDQSPVPPLRIAIMDDETVPAPKHLKPHPFALQDKLGEVYPPHTRVIHASSGNVCSLAYAVTYHGARKLLSEFGDRYDTQWDLMLQKWCEGKYATENKSQLDSDSEAKADAELRGTAPVCVTVQPPLFSHYYAEGGSSDILSQGGGYAKGTGSPYIRLSVRGNLERLASGAPESELVDQLPDDGQTIWK
ncbi:glycosyltransferase family 25 protein [Hypoxylon sp. FL0543]|nr:glycosyltransferase family 25 protein [Hypoxylon sp. FL0543]